MSASSSSTLAPPAAKPSGLTHSSSSDDLPPITCLNDLLHAVSLEVSNSSGVVRTQEEKLEVQKQLREHHEVWRMTQKQQKRAAQAEAASALPATLDFMPSDPSSSASSAATLDSVPKFDSLTFSESTEDLVAHLPLASSSPSPSAVDDPTAPAVPSPSPADPLSTTPLLRQLSHAARTGLISHEYKAHLKNSLLNEAYHSRSTLGPTRLVREVTDHGESIVKEERIDLSQIDEDACASMQKEERDVLEAIYVEDVKFEIVTQSIDREGRITEVEDRAGDDEEDDEEEEEKNGGESTTAEPSASSSSSSYTTSSSSSSASSGVVESQQCITVSVNIKPYPASGPERNLVSTVVRFSLPPLYPYIRPSFTLVSIAGDMTESDGMMCSTAIQEQINKIYHESEPLKEEDARVILFELINAAQEFLIEYIDFLEDAEYQEKLAKEEKARLKKIQDAEISRQEQERHVAAVLAYVNSDHKLLEFSSAEALAKRKKEIEAMKKREEEEQKRKDEEMRVFLKQFEQAEAKADGEMATQSFSYSFDTLLPSPDAIMYHLRTRDREFPEVFQNAFTKGQVRLKNIASKFLIYRFLKKRLQMQALRRPIETSIGFHATSPDAVQSITRNGLIMPGERLADGGTISVKHGSAYGVGIYLSPNASFSLNYGTLYHMFVCLVLRGRTMTVGSGGSSSAVADSHQSGDAMQWILFDSACVLPIYIFEGDISPYAHHVPPPSTVVATAAVAGVKTQVPWNFGSKPPKASKSAQLLIQSIQAAKTKKTNHKGPQTKIKKTQ